MPNLTTSYRFSIYHVTVLALVFFTFATSAWLSRSVFERLPHLEDEVAYLYQAKIFARGDLLIDTPQPRRAYWQPFVIDHAGKRFSKYTPGWSGLLSLGIHLGQPWVINAFFSALTITLAFRLGSNLFNRDVGLIASILVAFSPMALLLNASLMGHTAALFFTTLFILSYRQIEKTGAHRWGIVAGLALGFVVALRPLTAIGIGIPFIIWSMIRVISTLFERSHDGKRLSAMTKTLTPLLVLSAFTLLIASAVPIYNHATTGNPTRNLYTFVWDYDQLGFGECCGRNGHVLQRAVRHTRFDLSLTAADVFGWQIGDITTEIENHWLLESDYFPNIGLSFVLLPFGLLFGLLTTRYRPKQRHIGQLLAVWLVGLGILLVLALDSNADRIRDPHFSWLWIISAGIWLLAPLIVLRQRDHWQARWTWLLLCVSLGLVLAQMTYWIGSQRYSTRYYFEGLTAFAILSALPIAYLLRRSDSFRFSGGLRLFPVFTTFVTTRAGNNLGRVIIYATLGLVTINGLITYSLPRVNVLRGFNEINQALIDEIRLRQDGDKPILLLVDGDLSGENRVRWRALGTLMVVTSPYRDSEFVGAWYYGDPTAKAQILADYPDRQVIEMQAQGNDIWFVDSKEDSG